MTFSYPKYLDAKRTVDERARHPNVWDAFITRLRDAAARAARRGDSLRILEIGGGVGDLAIKIARALPSVPVEYTLVDIEPANLKAARRRLQHALPEAHTSHVLDGLGTTPASSPNHTDTATSSHTMFYLVRDDITCLGDGRTDPPVQKARTRTYDAVCGQAIMDIVPARILLQKASSMLRDKGAIYLPIHFDGRTDFEPLYNPEVDELVSSIYHESMTRTWEDIDGCVHTFNGSRSGRDLITHAESAGLSVMAAGASDWIVLPSDRREGGGADGYPSGEAHFLRCMLHFVESELSASHRISAEEADAWSSARRKQLAAGELAMFVHNLDVLLAHAT